MLVHFDPLSCSLVKIKIAPRIFDHSWDENQLYTLVTRDEVKPDLGPINLIRSCDPIRAPASGIVSRFSGAIDVELLRQEHIQSRCVDCIG